MNTFQEKCQNFMLHPSAQFGTYLLLLLLPTVSASPESCNKPSLCLGPCSSLLPSAVSPVKKRLHIDQERQLGCHPPQEKSPSCSLCSCFRHSLCLQCGNLGNGFQHNNKQLLLCAIIKRFSGISFFLPELPGQRNTSGVLVHFGHPLL